MINLIKTLFSISVMFLHNFLHADLHKNTHIKEEVPRTEICPFFDKLFFIYSTNTLTSQSIEIILGK